MKAPKQLDPVVFEMRAAAEKRDAKGRLSRLLGGIALAALVALPAAASITGVCPDGSIYIVQHVESIPCRDSKQVRPSDVPPLKPEMLPRPYGWEVFNRRNDPNNPYNLVDTGRAVRGNQPAPQTDPSVDSAPQPGNERAPEYAHSGSALPPVSSPPPVVAEPDLFDLAFDRDEVRDLALIVEYSQQRAPAMLARGGSDESPALVLRIAQSRSFEARLHDAASRAGRSVRGPVLLFTAETGATEAFYANLTFVQGHVAFHPDPASSEELGLIDGRLGQLTADERVLGYIVLPEHMNLSQPMDIYWNDRQFTATLRP